MEIDNDEGFAKEEIIWRKTTQKKDLIWILIVFEEFACNTV